MHPRRASRRRLQRPRPWRRPDRSHEPLRRPHTASNCRSSEGHLLRLRQAQQHPTTVFKGSECVGLYPLRRMPEPLNYLTPHPLRSRNPGPTTSGPGTLSIAPQCSSRKVRKLLIVMHPYRFRLNTLNRRSSEERALEATMLPSTLRGCRRRPRTRPRAPRRASRGRPSAWDLGAISPIFGGVFPHFCI